MEKRGERQWNSLRSAKTAAWAMGKCAEDDRNKECQDAGGRLAERKERRINKRNCADGAHQVSELLLDISGGTVRKAKTIPPRPNAKTQHKSTGQQTRLSSDRISLDLTSGPSSSLPRVDSRY
jgi:hypothetical protein